MVRVLFFSKGFIMKIKEIIVVEGKSDTVKIQHAVKADTNETNGSAINRNTLQQINHAQEKRGIIVFTDPDYPGERIRRIIQNYVPYCKHAFLTPQKARAKHPHHKSLGIEHASIKDIQFALDTDYETMPDYESRITQTDLLKYVLVGGQRVKTSHTSLVELLTIRSTNVKQ